MNESTLKFEDKIAGWHIGVALFALFLGSWFGPLQAFEHNSINLYKYLAPGIQSYYQGLSLHAVLNALVWTTFFITGFFTFIFPRSLKRNLRYPLMSTVALVLMLVGLVMAAIPLLLNMATVLYTFYPPMKASPFFYIGLTLVVVGSWVVGWNMYITYYGWRKENPGARTPFLAFGSLITMVMWQIATLGIAAEMLGLLIPWSLGLVKGTDPQLARTFFWFTGHPLVYFWLLPAYVSWYGMVPKQAGGKLFSDSLARLAFWLFLLLSVPLGFHHQYVDPGVPQAWKFIHAVLTYSVAFPSLMTAFTLAASLENAGRTRGGKGLLGWIRNLLWSEPSFTAQTLAMIIFAFGGIGGLTNASYNINLVVHNTTWIPGHFHLTVGTAVTLSFIGITYWLLPKLTGKELWSRKAALIQAWLWFAGMALMGNGLHLLGLHYGAPRRTMLGAAPYRTAEWSPYLLETLVGAIILFASGATYLALVLGTVFSKRTLKTPVEMPVAEAIVDPVYTPQWLDRWAPWLVGTIVLILVAYGPMLFQLISQAQLTSPVFKVW